MDTRQTFQSIYFLKNQFFRFLCKKMDPLTLSLDVMYISTPKFFAIRPPCIIERFEVFEGFSRSGLAQKEGKILHCAQLVEKH